jgi:polyhydroxyalkanoate synthesis regulator phasin
MFDFLKKTYLFGLGLATLTSDKIEEVVDDLVKRGEVAEKDRSKVVEDFLTRANEEKDKLSKTVNGFVKKTVHEMGLPTQDEHLELKKRVDDLEKELRAKKDDGPAV